MTDAPPPTNDRTIGTEAREWCIVDCLDAFRDEHGRPGTHKRPETDLAALCTRSEAWDEPREWERRHPSRDVSMRRGTPVSEMLERLGR